MLDSVKVCVAVPTVVEEISVTAPAAGVVQAGTPADTLKTWLAVPIPNRATVAEPEAYRMSPAAVTVFFGIAVPAKS
jgi:hypothetical protein